MTIPTLLTTTSNKRTARLKKLRDDNGFISRIVDLSGFDHRHLDENIFRDGSSRKIGGCCRYDAMDVDRCIVRQLSFLRQALNEFNAQTCCIGARTAGSRSVPTDRHLPFLFTESPMPHNRPIGRLSVSYSSLQNEYLVIAVVEEGKLKASHSKAWSKVTQSG